MSCVNFKTKEKNNKWREVALDLEKEKSIPKYFGVDTETRVDELLQNNITLFDWIRKNQGFPYFIGRRINGDNALTSEEMSYIASNGSKAIPILTAVSEKSAKDNAKMFQAEATQNKLIMLCKAIRKAWRLEREEAVYPWEQYLKESIAYVDPDKE